jgi:8-oxo-dGTP pyrophosphatase MutT (NUDIX family)
MMDLGRGTPDAPLHSATVLMLRDVPAGLQVFLLKRHGLSDVHGGAYVFPGGKLDQQDLPLVDRLDQPAAALHAALGEPALDERQAAALYVAGIREVMEEAGVLFAAWEPGMPAVQDLRAAGHGLAAMLQLLKLPLAPAWLVPWSRWITPVASVRARKHFDARFFVATVPPSQEPVHDAHETTESVWLAPAAALREYWERRIELAPPQIMSLAHLARFRSVADVMAHARSRTPPRIQPEVVQVDGASMVCYPGDPLHSVPGVLVPGPSRLCWRNERYEPLAGLDALLD